MSSYLERYDLFVFDLDGTLADTAKDLAVSLNHALESLGRAPLELEAVMRLVGNGAPVLIRRALGGAANDENVDRGLKSFVAHYRTQCVRQTVLYPGVREALEALASPSRGKQLAVLTNKPLDHSEKILSALGIRGFFRTVKGGDSVPEKKPHPAGLRAIMEELGLAPARTILVGDSATDTLTARAAGAAAAFVTYGFQPEAFRETPPDHLLASLLDLL